MPDHLAAWLRVRAGVRWPEIVPHPEVPISARHDGFVRFIEEGRDAERQRRLLAAYDDMRREDAGLGPDLLARWNGILRGVPVVTFRDGPAFAKNGRERYDLHPGTERLFAAGLAEAADPEIPVTARAARAYLDVNFFHPYADGNARLAALVLMFVLRRGSVELDEVAPILTTVRRADDADGAAGLARMIHGIAAATRRREVRGDLPFSPG